MKKIRLAAAAAALILISSGCGAKPKEVSSQRTSDVESKISADSNSTSSAASGTASNSKESQKDLLYLTGDSQINVYKDENASSVAASLPCAAAVEVESQGAAFTKVKIPDENIVGYVDNNYLTTTPESVSDGQEITADENAQLMENSDGTGSVLLTLTPGEKLRLLAKTPGGYWRAASGETVGYISVTAIRSDLKPSGSTASWNPVITDSVSAPQDEPSQTTTVTTITDNPTPSPSSQGGVSGGTPAPSVTSEPSVSSAPSSYGSSSVLSSALSTAQAQNGGNWSAALIDLQTGELSEVNSSVMQAASLIKLYIMGAIYENYDEYKAQNANLDSLLHSMITVSDNTAANTLVGILGGGDTTAGRGVVTSWAQSHGYSSTSMGRLLLESTINGDNYTSTVDCARFLSAAYNGELPHSAEMMNLLSQQTRTSKIPAGVPVRTANKTGELDSVQNDAAVVYADPPYVLCVMSENVPYAAADSIAQLSSTVYSGITG